MPDLLKSPTLWWHAGTFNEMENKGILGTGINILIDVIEFFSHWDCDARIIQN